MIRVSHSHSKRILRASRDRIGSAADVASAPAFGSPVEGWIGAGSFLKSFILEEREQKSPGAANPSDLRVKVECKA